MVGLQVNACLTPCVCACKGWKGAQHDEKMNYPGNNIKKPQTSTSKFAALAAFPIFKPHSDVSDENNFLTDTEIIIK